jgi:hypothetical protein
MYGQQLKPREFSCKLANDLTDSNATIQFKFLSSIEAC